MTGDTAPGCLSRELIDRLHAGDLSPEEQTQAEAHLAACPQCAAKKAEMYSDCARILERLKDLDPVELETKALHEAPGESRPAAAKTNAAHLPHIHG